jgi:serine/threonine protein kinase
MRAQRLNPGAQFGAWKLESFINSGGNGSVWKAINIDGRPGAIKFIHSFKKNNSKRYARFQHEIVAMRKLKDVSGVLPILDFHLPDVPSDTAVPWLVTPVAVPFPYERKQCEFAEALQICVALAATLARLHEIGIAHRDIKPSNIFMLDDQWMLGDFGLATFPGKPKLTGRGEKLGPLHYIAPEMLNKADGADGPPADVYSLAKLLWKLAEGERYPFPGEHTATAPQLAHGRCRNQPNIEILDRLLELATQHEYLKRPTMADVQRELVAWIQQSKHPRQNHLNAKNKARALQPLAREAPRLNARGRIAREEALRDQFFSALDEEMNDIFREMHKLNIPTSIGYFMFGTNSFAKILFPDWERWSNNYSLHESTIDLKLAKPPPLNEVAYYKEIRAGFILQLQTQNVGLELIEDVNQRVSATVAVLQEEHIDGRLEVRERVLFREDTSFYLGLLSEVDVLGTMVRTLRRQLFDTFAGWPEKGWYYYKKS